MTQADCTIKFYAYISSVWTLLNDTAGSDAVSGSWGMRDNNPTTRVASTGSITVTLNNSTGIYSPNGVNALSGWKKGIPLKMVITYDGEDKEFHYYISDIDAKSDSKNKKATVTAVDWLDYAARHPIVNPGIQSNKRGDELLNTLLGLIEVDPLGTDFDTGTETFPTVFDTVTSQTKAYSEFAKVALSELGFIYEKKDGSLVFEASSARHGWREVDQIPYATGEAGYLLKEDGGYLLKEDGGKIALNAATTHTFTGSDIFDYDAPYGKHVINKMTVYANPRKLSASPEVLFELNEPIAIGSGQTVTIKGTYANPSGGLPINAQDMITPVITTDFLVNTKKDGTGTNLSSDLILTSTPYGTEGFTHQVTNNNASGGWITKYNYRGTGIYIYNKIEHAAINSASIEEFEAEEESINQKYKNDLYSGTVFVESKVDEHNQPRTVLNTIVFYANKNAGNMAAFLYYDVGSLHYIQMDDQGLSGNYYIQGIEYQITGGVIMVKWIVVLALSLQTGCGLTPVATEFRGGTYIDGINFGYLPGVYSDTTPSTIAMSAWINLSTLPSTKYYSIIAPFSDSGGILLRMSQTSPGEVAFYHNIFNVSPGIWTTTDSSIAIEDWYHVVVTIDIASASNKPSIYVNSILKTIAETSTPSGSLFTKNANIVIGNLKTATGDYNRPFDGEIFDPRVYNRILTQTEITELYNAGVPSASVGTKDGLVFQGMAVRTENLANYVDQPLTSTLTVRDNVFGAVGVPHGSPIGRVAP